MVHDTLCAGMKRWYRFYDRGQGYLQGHIQLLATVMGEHIRKLIVAWCLHEETKILNKYSSLHFRTQQGTSDTIHKPRTIVRRFISYKSNDYLTNLIHMLS